MNLKNGKITLQELLKHPGARALLEREAPGASSSPLVRRLGGLTLAQAMVLLRGRIPSRRMEALLQELENL